MVAQFPQPSRMHSAARIAKRQLETNCGRISTEMETCDRVNEARVLGVSNPSLNAHDGTERAHLLHTGTLDPQRTRLTPPVFDAETGTLRVHNRRSRDEHLFEGKDSFPLSTDHEQCRACVDDDLIAPYRSSQAIEGRVRATASEHKVVPHGLIASVMVCLEVDQEPSHRSVAPRIERACLDRALSTVTIEQTHIVRTRTCSARERHTESNGLTPSLEAPTGDGWEHHGESHGLLRVHAGLTMWPEWVSNGQGR